MYTMYLADIRAEDYEPFRSIPTLGLPDTFNEWAYKRREFSAKISGGGNEAIGVEVKPDEFADFCRNTGAPANLHSLDRFAAEKARNQGKISA